MIEYFTYWIMNLVGYRKICFDLALARGINLDSYRGWFYYPSWKKGTYREEVSGGRYEFKGYGIDK